ncbi:MAG: 2-oxoisovalerate dehydrogenase [Nitrospinae bacterium]|nr:2-oxoisovalerate dehydrogenase [Nitrospinota bacterium]
MIKSSNIMFEVTEAVEGGYDARALGYSIFTQGEDWDDLKAMVRDAVLCHFGEEDAPKVRVLKKSREAVFGLRARF